MIINYNRGGENEGSDARSISRRFRDGSTDQGMPHRGSTQPGTGSDRFGVTPNRLYLSGATLVAHGEQPVHII